MGVSGKTPILAIEDFGVGSPRGVMLGKYVIDPAARLPRWDGSLAFGLRHELRALDELHLVDVARAVGEDLAGADADDELGLRIFGHEWVVVADGRFAVEAHAVLVLEIDEEDADLLRLEDVPHRQVHAVPVVVGEGDGVVVDDADEAGLAALVGAVGVPLLVDGGDKEHVHVLDEGAVVLVDRVVREVADAVGQALRVEAALELAVAVVEDGVRHEASGGGLMVSRWLVGGSYRGSTGRAVLLGGEVFGGRGEKPGDVAIEAS